MINIWQSVQFFVCYIYYINERRQKLILCARAAPNVKWKTSPIGWDMQCIQHCFWCKKGLIWSWKLLEIYYFFCHTSFWLPAPKTFLGRCTPLSFNTMTVLLSAWKYCQTLLIFSCFLPEFMCTQSITNTQNVILNTGAQTDNYVFKYSNTCTHW